ncbi:MAG: hypothetical protein AAGF31_02150 [Planctomycetota bacterium]
MSLPSIKTSLPVILVCWAVGAVLAGLTPLLVYPAMWLAVAGIWYGLNLAVGHKQAASTES